MIETIKNNFKTIQITGYYISTDLRENRAKRFFLASLLSSHNDINKTRIEQNRFLESNYLMSIGSKVEIIGGLSVLALSITFIAPTIVTDAKLVEEAINLYNATIANRKYFSNEIFIEEKRIVLEAIKAEKDNKFRYASNQYGKILLNNSLHALPLFGTPNDVKKLGIDDVTNYFEKSFDKTPDCLIINGPLDYILLDTIKKRIIVKEPNNYQINCYKRKNRNETMISIEDNPAKQSVIKIGYHLPVYYNDDLIPAVIIFDTILGGSPSSFLFQEIREKRGLCYAINSSFNPNIGFLSISLAVANENVEIAVQAIKDLIEEIPTKLTEETFENAKRIYLNSFISQAEYQPFPTRRRFFELLMPKFASIEKRIEEIKGLSLDDVKKVYPLLSLDTVYVLRGVENEN